MKRPIDAGKRFLELAERDILAFNALKDNSTVHSETVLFHAQQAVEKILKAILIAHDIAPTRTHDLEALAYSLENIPMDLPLSLQDLATLNPYAVTLRYENSIDDILTREQADTIIKAMYSWARKYFETSAG